MSNKWTPGFSWPWMVGFLCFVLTGMLAFTAANSVPGTKAGDGSAAITGYTVSNVHYELNDTNPGNIDEVTLTLDSPPPDDSTMRIQLVNAGTWYDCTNTLADLVCDTTVGAQATVSASDQLRVVVAQ